MRIFIACENLRRQGFDVFLPYHFQNGSKKWQIFGYQSPTISGVFVYMGTTIDTIPWKSVNGTRGISKAVTTSTAFSDPLVLSYHEGLQSRCDDDGVIQRLNDIVAAIVSKLREDLC